MRTAILGLADPNRRSNSTAVSVIASRSIISLSCFAGLRSKSLPIFRREEEPKDHVPEVTRISVQCVEPVLEAYCIRIAPQVTEILHCHEFTIEEPVPDQLAFDDVAQHT